jgi:hypothetical protein
MPRPYPLGYSVSVTITQYEMGPHAVLQMIPERHGTPQKLSGMVDRSCLDDVSVMVFALLAELEKVPEENEPF